MGENSGVKWTDASVSFWMGCRPISSGCRSCYARRDMTRFGREFDTVIRCSDHTFYASLRWQAKRIFVCPWSDFFIAEADPWRADAWDVIRRTPQHTWLILTKRPGRIPICLPRDWGNGWDHVWLGTSAENQRWLDKRVPPLLGMDSDAEMGRNFFLSLEPLLGPVDLSLYLVWPASIRLWVIVGGQSGPNASPCEPGWVQSVVDQCKAASVPVWVKQDSHRYPGRQGRLSDDLWAVKELPWKP